MATIGSITVAFGADLRGLSEGIESSIDLFDDISERIEQLNEELESLSEQVVTVRTRVDTSGAAAAVSEIADLSDSIPDVSVAVTAETSEAVENVSSAGGFFETFFRQLSSSASGASSAVTESLTAASDGLQSSVERIGAASQAAGRSIDGSVGAIEGAIVTTGRAVVAFRSCEAALASVGAAGATFASFFGGVGVISAAVAGSVAATAIAVGSVASSFAAAVTGAAAYAGILTVLSPLTASMSEEARGYVRAAAAVAAGFAGVRAGATAYAIVADAVFRSATAGEFFQRVFAGASSAIAGGTAIAGGAVTVFNRLAAVLGIVSAAGRESTTALGFAGVVAQTVAASTAIGGLAGAVGGLIAGTGAYAGAVAGATSALSGLASAFPATAALAIAAAVATGRFSDELDRISGQAESVEQMADRFGAPRESIERLRLAAANAGVGLSQLAKGQQAFYTSLSKIKVGQLNVDSVREAKLAFDRLGISLDDVKNRNPDQVFAQVAAKLSAVKDPADRTAIAFDLFGKQGAAILPALKEFGTLAADFKRLGGALSEVDFNRLTSLEDSFDRIKAASNNLRTVILLPFTELQKAFNNVAADAQGGLASALAPLASLLADITKPLAVIIELFGRVLNILLRVVGVATTLVTAFADFGMIADLFNALGQGVLFFLGYIERAVAVVEEIASVTVAFVRPAIVGFDTVGEAVQAFAATVIGAVVSLATFQLAMQSTAVQAVASAAMTHAAWVAGAFAGILGIIPVLVAGFGALVVSMISTAAAALVAGTQVHVAWLMALGPLGLLIGAVELALIGFIGLVTVGREVGEFFAGIGRAIGLIGTETPKINAATASVEELAAATAAADEASRSATVEPVGAERTAEVDFGEGARTASAEFEAARKSYVEFGMSFGVSAEQAGAAFDEIIRLHGEMTSEVSTGPTFDQVKESISSARDQMGELIISSAQFGQAGADAASQAQSEFNKLQQSLADKKISLEEFEEGAAKLTEDLQKNLDILKDDSPEITLKKNLELYKQLGDAAKEAGKKVREISSGTVVDGKLFPASDEIKARATEYKNQYVAALEEIKKKQQSGGFAQDLKKQRAQLESDKASGKVSTEQYVQMKAELDQTSAQEQAQIAVENVQREFDRNTAKIEADVSFANNIRKELETAFLSPVEKFKKELDKIKNNDSLTTEEKDLAEKNLRKQAREGLIGKTATEQFNERQRDLKQGADSDLISIDEMRNGMLQNLDALANALGIPVNPANQMEVSLSELKTALDKGTISAEDYAKGVKAARDKFLAELGIEKPKFEQDNERMAELERQKKAGKLSDDEFARGKKAIENSIVGQSAADKIAEDRRRIENGMRAETVDTGRGQAALRSLDSQRRQAAGLDDSPAQQLQLGVDKVNDAFGVAGKTMDEIQATLSPAEFEEYQKAIKKNSDAVRANLGVEKTGAQQIAESREKLAQAVKDNVITEGEKNKALKQQRDSLLSSLGISKSPTQDFEDAVQRIKENAAELSPEETAKGLKAAKDKLLSALGIDKAPSDEFADRMKDLNEAAQKGRISQEELAKGAQKAKDSLLQSLGIPLDPVVQLGQRLKDLDAAFASGAIDDKELARGQEEARRSMLPGGEEESPVKKFERDIEAVGRAVEDGLISEEDGAARKKNLQAQLQEDLAPALDSTKQDRRGVEGADARSKAGVDTFFRILRGNDNPSLKAQLEIARNTKVLAEASRNPDAAPVIAQLSAR